MRLTAFIEYALIIVGALGIAAARYFALPKGVHLGIFAIGAGVMIGALESFYTRRMGLRLSEGSDGAYNGMPAVIWGGMLFFVAGCVIGAAYALDAGRWGAVTAYLKQRPGAQYALTGLLLMGAGALAFVNPQGWRVWWKTLLFRVPRVLFAVLLVLAGLIALACGAWEWLDPRDFQKASRVILSIMESSLPQDWSRTIDRLRR
jgi:hypothetical protein